MGLNGFWHLSRQANKPRHLKPTSSLHPTASKKLHSAPLETDPQHELSKSCPGHRRHTTCMQRSDQKRRDSRPLLPGVPSFGRRRCILTLHGYLEKLKRLTLKVAHFGEPPASCSAACPRRHVPWPAETDPQIQRQAESQTFNIQVQK